MIQNISSIGRLVIAAMLAAFAVNVEIAIAEEPVVRGSVVLPDGIAIKSYPVIISGRTVEGEEYSSFVTTNDDGQFEVMELPPGSYQVMPAGRPENAMNFTVPRTPWFSGRPRGGPP
jgi:hypothetical protein